MPHVGRHFDKMIKALEVSRVLKIFYIFLVLILGLTIRLMLDYKQMGPACRDLKNTHILGATFKTYQELWSPH